MQRVSSVLWPGRLTVVRKECQRADSAAVGEDKCDVEMSSVEDVREFQVLSATLWTDGAGVMMRADNAKMIIFLGNFGK
jgi:hypothetical protein